MYNVYLNARLVKRKRLSVTLRKQKGVLIKETMMLVVSFSHKIHKKASMVATLGLNKGNIPSWRRRSKRHAILGSPVQINYLILKITGLISVEHAETNNKARLL